MLYPKPQIYHDLKAIFVHVPKTAGTSIERQLAESSGIEIGGHTTAPAFRRAYPKEFASYFKFTVVREPFGSICLGLSLSASRGSASRTPE